MTNEDFDAMTTDEFVAWLTDLEAQMEAFADYAGFRAGEWASVKFAEGAVSRLMTLSDLTRQAGSQFAVEASRAYFSERPARMTLHDI